MRSGSSSRIFTALFVLLCKLAQAQTPPEDTAEHWKRREALPTEEERAAYDADYKRRLHDYYAGVSAGTTPISHESPSAWIATLNPLPSGGWSRVTIADDFSEVFYISRRTITRRGGYIYVWYRMEFRDPQVWQTGYGASKPNYLGLVERSKIDCALRTMAVLTQTGFAGHNLTAANSGEDETADEAKAQTTSAIPGTIGESLIEAACQTSGASSQGKP